MDKTKLSSTVTVKKYRNMVNDQDKDGIRHHYPGGEDRYWWVDKGNTDYLILK